jgi:hypothetical protein
MIKEELYDLLKTKSSEIAFLSGTVERLKDENEKLKDWKESALNVMPNFQEMAKLLNIPLGASVSGQIIPGIKALQSRVKELESVLGKVESLQDGIINLIK